MTDTRELSDPEFFSRLDGIELRARAVVEGFLHGLHRSPFVGFSVEFASHHEYVPGDDPRHINWKLYARQHRLYVKEFDGDTNLNLYVLLDVSGSMACANKGRSKLAYAATLTAALAHLAIRQHDAAGVTLFADEVLANLPPRATAHQQGEILGLIAGAAPRAVTDAGKAIHQAAELCRKRGLVVVISDGFDDLARLTDALDHLLFLKHEVILFQVLDPWERDLPLEGNVQFRDLETGETLTTLSESVRDGYQAAVREWLNDLDRECRSRGIDRIELTTDDPLDKALLEYFVRRGRMV
ncbi:Uncharacterized protein OS=candidate division ZIXI bacterium RBG-1 GN=RBG1_1C00001G0202 PE=4 SV=1: DUF58 [Gemmata massiliana]|uniref:DUF58 domain-containing protein n=1 Tax=Gemmata massiliana TaxID=1210884 RepID=A0A6P2D6S6_9BACT|nr:DUF58 domain-containing protein [Gemmata massiliana]VTR96166.1 Uncharacterized protein OS=candidate division ZIXI bacterium RBG-1 GN=RBG1_1C00001G0202 PE=4 SV=1: DUF58 [Gemmata massiliana]